MAETEQKTPAPYIPPSQIAPEELAKAFQEDGIVEPSPAKPAEPVKTESPPAAPPAPKDEPALLRIARERDALRKQEEAARPYVEASKAFSPTELQRLAQARASGNPVAVLAAAGFTHAQYTQALLGEKVEPPPAEKPTGNPEFDALRQEIAALKAEREAERLNISRQQGIGKMKEILKGNAKFDLVNKTEEYEGVERVILDHIAQYGKPPGETFEETVLLGAEMYEAKLKKEAERWQKVLTGFQSSASTPPQKAPESQPSPGAESPRTLTNSNTSAPAAVRPVPKSREEVLAALIEGREADLDG